MMATVNRKNKHFSETTSPVDDSPRYFLNPESVSKHLYCSICQDVFSQPQRAPCGHSFCRKCITLWLKNSRTCPEDRKPVQMSQLHHDFILENIIGDQMVACPHRSIGCEVITQLHLLSSHVKSCDFNPSNQPEFVRRRVLSTIENVPFSPNSPSGSDSEGVVPSPGKPSLIMRLYKSDSQKKEMLKTMFDKKS
ncbi:RING finger protein 151-like [Babylonia areolata]|uniref:RING finger protein 151-like n=1 Tax=Babylonia areolata TaxID=304850 RepID=UPI003FD5A41F